MKLLNLFALAFVLFALHAKAQTKADVFHADKSIVFLGVDYSHAQFVGPVSGWGEITTKTPREIRDTYFLLWNNTIQNEPQNFKFAEALNRKEVSIATKSVQKTNEAAKTDRLFADAASDVEEISEKDIPAMVKKYNLPESGDIGMVLICEQMDKNLKSATYWISFLDLHSGKVLFSKKESGSASGFGFKNYWLGSIKSILKSMKKDFKTWK